MLKKVNEEVFICTQVLFRFYCLRLINQLIVCFTSWCFDFSSMMYKGSSVLTFQVWYWIMIFLYCVIDYWINLKLWIELYNGLYEHNGYMNIIGLIKYPKPGLINVLLRFSWSSYIYNYNHLCCKTMCRYNFNHLWYSNLQPIWHN